MLRKICDTDAMITLHHLEYSQSFRILWLLEELGVEYNFKAYERDPAMHLALAAYKALSPTGAAPVITAGDQVLAESSAIVDYVLDLHPNDQLRPPPGSPHRARYLFWLHAAQGSMMPLLLMDSVFLIIRKRVPFFFKSILRGVFGKARAGLSKPRMDALLRKAEADLAEAPPCTACPSPLSATPATAFQPSGPFTFARAPNGTSQMLEAVRAVPDTVRKPCETSRNFAHKLPHASVKLTEGFGSLRKVSGSFRKP